MIDLWKGRRDIFNKCKYWSQNENEDAVSIGEISYNKSNYKTFYAKVVNAITVDNQIIQDSFLVESNTVTLMTKDNISDMKVNDKVEFNEKEYMVESIQKILENRQRQYRRTPSYTYYISLRG